MTMFNFILSNGVPYTGSFTIYPISFTSSSGSYLVTGDPWSSSLSPFSYSLNQNTYKVESNTGYSATSDWFISASPTTVTASSAIVSGSYATGSLCAVTFNFIDNKKTPDTAKSMSIKPTSTNVGFNDSFVKGDELYYSTDASGSLVVNLVPQAYTVHYYGGYQTERFTILVPASSSAYASQCMVTSNKVVKVITPQNQSLYARTAQDSDARYLSISGSVNSASYAGTASVLLGSIQSASYANTASFALNAGNSLTTGSTYPVTSSWANTASVATAINFVPTVAVSASYASRSLSASYAPIDPAYSASIATVKQDTLVTGNTYTITASVASNSVSASFATTASNALYAKTSFVDDINNGLVVYLPFNEGSGSVIRNYSPYGVDATKYFTSGAPIATGSGWNTNSKRGGYSQLLTVPGVGSASYIEMNNSTIADNLSQMSFAIWYQSSGSTTNSGRIVTKFNSGTNGAFSYQFVDPNQIAVILVNSLSQRVAVTVNTPTLNDNKWHHIVGNYDGNSGSVYVDGLYMGGVALTGSLNTTLSPLRIGTFENLAFQPTIGYVDEFKLWNRALTANEIRYLYLDGNLENNIYVDANGNRTISGSTTFLAGATGSLNGNASTSTTASYALTASALLGSITSASYALSASYAPGSPSVSSSYALTASFSLNGGGSSLTTGSTYPITSSWANNSRTASYLNSTASNASIAQSLVTSFGTIASFGLTNTHGYNCNEAFAPDGGITDSTNDCLAINVNGSHFLNDTTGTTTLDFSSKSLIGNWSGSISNANTASYITASNIKGNVATASVAINLNTGNGNIVGTTDGLSNQVLRCNSGFSPDAGIWDIANAGIAIQTSGSHILYTTLGQAKLDFTNFAIGKLLGNWTGSVSNSTSASYANTASYASTYSTQLITSSSFASSSISASYVSGSNASIVHISASNLLSFGGTPLITLTDGQDILCDVAANLVCTTFLVDGMDVRSAAQISTTSDINSSANITASAFKGNLFSTQVNTTGITASAVLSDAYQFNSNFTATQTASFTINNANNGKFVIVNSGSAVNITLTTSSISSQFNATYFQSGSGVLNFITASNSVILRNRGNHTGSAGQFAVCNIVRLPSGDFLLSGDVA